MQIHVDEPLRRLDVQDAVVTVDAGDELLAGGDEDLLVVVRHHHDGVVAHFQELAAGADLALLLVCYRKSDHFVEIETVAGQFGQLAQGQVKFHAHKVAGFVGPDSGETGCCPDR